MPKTSLEKNLPYTLLRVNITCNAKCLFCNIPQEAFPHKNLTLTEIKQWANLQVANNKNMRLSISGGEPTIRKDLCDIIKLLSKNGVNTIELQTNAIALSDGAYVRALKKAGLSKVFVALHSHIPLIHDILVGKRGTYEKCIRGIKNCLENKLEVILNPVLTTLNTVFLVGFFKFLSKDLPGVKSLSLSVVQPRGRAWKNKDIVPRYRELDRYVASALKIAERSGLVVNNPYCGLPLCIGKWYAHLEHCVEYCENALHKGNPLSRDKVKPDRCNTCALTSYCNGVWNEYASMYPLEDLRPLQKKNGKFSPLKT